jgi:hypothetical protein
MTNEQVTEMAIKWLRVGSLYSVDMWDKGMIHTSGQMELDDTRFCHTTQNGMQFKT